MTTKIDSMVGAVAHAIGSLSFTPTSSVVLIMTTGAQVVCTLRVDAAPTISPKNWADRIRVILDQVPAHLDGAMLISFEDAHAMTAKQYTELVGALARRGAPVKAAILVTDGKVMDYDGDSTDAVDFFEVFTHPINIKRIVTTPAEQLAADAPHCKAESEEVAQIRTNRFRQVEALGHRGVEILAQSIHDELTEQLEAYRREGNVNEKLAGWVAGTFQSKNGRDFIMAGMATDENDLEKVSKTLLGELDITDIERFETAAKMLYEALEHISGSGRTNVLVGLAWARWMLGKGTEAQQFLEMALASDPDHRLAQLLSRFFDLGTVPKSATGRVND